MDTVELLEKKNLRTDLTAFDVGDTVDVHYRIMEGDKERIQIFNGTVIRIRRGGPRTTFTVRRMVSGEGVERIFPLHSPKIAKIGVKRHGRVRRAKLYYLRDRVGKAVKVKEEQGTRPQGKRGRASRKTAKKHAAIVVPGSESPAGSGE